MALTEEQIENADKGVQFIDDVATKMGTATNRLGNEYKTLPQVIADATADLATRDIGEGAAAQINQRISAVVLPICTAVVSTNTVDKTRYDVTPPPGFNLGATGPNGKQFNIVIPEANKSNLVELNVAGEVREVFFVSDRRLRAGWTATFEVNNGGFRWNYIRQTPSGSSVQTVEDSAATSAAITASMVGAPIAQPIQGNPDELFAPNGVRQDSQQFKIYIATQPSPALAITVPNEARLFTCDANGNPLPAGTIKGNAVSTFAWSGGYNKYVFYGSEPTPSLPELKELAKTTAPDIWKVVKDAVDNPYGGIAKDGNNRPVFTPKQLYALGRGSSVSTDAANQARAGGCPSDHVPLFLLRDGMNDKFGPGLNVNAYNYSHGGHVAVQGDGQWNEYIAAGYPIPDILFDCFGMNDLSPYAYNTGQVSPTYLLGGYYADIKSRLDAGVKLVIVATTPHENTDKYNYALDGVPMIWPYPLPKGVQPDQLVPPAAQSVVNRDWTGRGIKRNGSARAAHVNNMLRELVRRFNADPIYRGRVVLCDAGWSWFRNGLEKYTLAQLYGSQEIVHPIELGHTVSYDPCIREIVDAMQRGQADKWWFRGEDAMAA